ncbi:MAG: hypothetical protein ABR969_05280 [Sedimentisphaerales bacterium]|jgi:hypothetical protein
MKTAMIEIENKVDQLLVVLDNDIQHLQDNLSTLNELRGLVIKRDDVSLQKLLESIQSESNSYKENELKRRLLREELAVALDCSLAQMTLSRLETALSEDKKTEIVQRKIKLQTLAGKLKKEHSSTAMLLSDCARFNSVLLKGILEFGQAGTITYSSRGFAERQINPAFINLQF